MVPQTDLVKELSSATKPVYLKVNEKWKRLFPDYMLPETAPDLLRQVVTSAADGAVAATASDE